jgi:hypothetical protein
MDLCQILMHPVDIEKMAGMALFRLFKVNFFLLYMFISVFISLKLYK